VLKMREMCLNEEERCVIITKEYQQPYHDARHHQERTTAALNEATARLRQEH
jgi:hypothetical protein